MAEQARQASMDALAKSITPIVPLTGQNLLNNATGGMGATGELQSQMAVLRGHRISVQTPSVG